MPYCTSLVLKKLQLKVRLGVTKAERAKKQTVKLDLQIFFAKPPQACHSDKIADTICYDNLARKIQEFCSDKEFALIEYLGYQLFCYIKKLLPRNSKLDLTLIKKPPLRSLDRSEFVIKD